MLLISQSQWPNLVPYPLFISWRSIFLIATVVCIICLKLLLFLMFNLQFVFRFDFLAFVFRCFVFIIANIKYLLFFFFFYFIYLFIFFSLVKSLLLIQKKKKKFVLVVYFILFYLCVCVFIGLQALLGGTIQVPSITGDVVLKVCLLFTYD